MATGTSSTRAPRLALRLGAGSLRRDRRASDSTTFEEIYRQHHQAIFRYCRSILRHDEDALDALQSTFANAYAALQRDARGLDLRPWLFRIAHNESISLLRRRRTTENLDAAMEVGRDTLPADLATREELRLLQADLADLAIATARPCSSGSSTGSRSTRSPWCSRRLRARSSKSSSRRERRFTSAGRGATWRVTTSSARCPTATGASSAGAGTARTCAPATDAVRSRRRCASVPLTWRRSTRSCPRRRELRSTARS